ncbi:OmpA family protein [Fodinisporobacter ferrooxydans]|uniref:OmpA family protein n=1 Tax=Fodinisporobacter ferrooxydans TaxID=2901836 RepID=A0ABY4CQ73_9BACL|nr:OmpA family protein [Alicyclobacillaceae bacterium MYW30-H2]
MSRRRRKREKPQNHERWLITYADLITLLMIFFVVMYAMSKIDMAKFMTLSESLNQALYASDKIQLHNLGTTALLAAQNAKEGNQHGNESDKTKVDSQSFQTGQQQKLEQLYQQLKEYITQNHLENKISIQDQMRGVQVTLKDVVLYDTGSATLKQDGIHVIQNILPFLKSVNNPIVVEGHTDNIPIHNSRYPSNWELSVARAVNVVHYLANAGIDPSRMSATGYGEWHPVVPNDNEADRQKNRRVNIVILRNYTQQEEAPYQTAPAPVSPILKQPAQSSSSISNP